MRNRTLRLASGLVSLAAWAAPSPELPGTRMIPTPSTGAIASSVQVTLERAYAAARERSESLAISHESVVQAEERHRQALGAVLPSVDLNASITKQQTPDSLKNDSTYRDTSKLVKVTATQPLFQGLREYAALRSLDASLKAEQSAFERARQLLFQDVATTYLGVLSTEKDLGDLSTELDYLNRRRGELSARVKIGRSREAEMLTVEASIESLKATQASVQAQLAAQREDFAFLTGLPSSTTLAPYSSPNEGLPELDALLKSVEQRPDIEAARQRSEAAKEDIAIARGGHLPTVDLVGNYYPVRTGSLEDVKWDVGLGLTLPIFAGGATQSKVREAASASAASRLAYEATKRQAEQDIRGLHAALTATREQLDRLNGATQLYEKNYKQTNKDYSYGLVTNLDVLTALINFQESQRALDRVRASFEADRVRLWIASGQMPPSTSGTK